MSKQIHLKHKTPMKVKNSNRPSSIIVNYPNQPNRNIILKPSKSQIKHIKKPNKIAIKPQISKHIKIF